MLKKEDKGKKYRGEEEKYRGETEKVQRKENKKYRGPYQSASKAY